MLAVTGIGMVSALGLDVVTSCAAARAGIQRIIEIDDIYVEDLDGEDMDPVAVHRIPRISAGLFGFTRLLRFGMAALDDLLRTDPSLRESRLGMILIVDGGVYQEAWERRRRDKAREEKAAGTAPGPEDSEESEEDPDFHALRDRVVRDLLSALVREAGLSVAPPARVTVATTAVGFVAALRQAEDWLTRGICDRCLLGGVDSLIDSPVLAAIDGLGLLKTPNRPIGMIPGEASCFLILEQPHGAAARRSPIQALLDFTVTAHEAAHPLLDENGRDGGGLRAAIAEVLARQPDGGRATGLAVANLNGDPYRSLAWGRCLVPTGAPLDLGALPLWIPPLFFGDIGAATGPVSIALLARGWARGYAPPSNALLCIMDDAGARGVVYVRAPKEVRA